MEPNARQLYTAVVPGQTWSIPLMCKTHLLSLRCHVGGSIRTEPQGTHSGLPHPGSPTPGEGGREGLSTLLSHGVGLRRRGGREGKTLSDCTTDRTNLNEGRGVGRAWRHHEEQAQVQPSHTLPLPTAYPSRIAFPSLITH